MSYLIGFKLYVRYYSILNTTGLVYKHVGFIPLTGPIRIVAPLFFPIPRELKITKIVKMPSNTGMLCVGVLRY